MTKRLVAVAKTRGSNIWTLAIVLCYNVMIILTFNARALFSSRVKCSSSDFFIGFLSRACGLGVAPVPCGSVYVWLWLTTSCMPRFCLAKSNEHEYLISDCWLSGWCWAWCLLIPPMAPSRLWTIGWPWWCMAYGSYSYLIGTSGCWTTGAPGTWGKFGTLLWSWKNLLPNIWCFFWATGWRTESPKRLL